MAHTVRSGWVAAVALLAVSALAAGQDTAPPPAEPAVGDLSGQVRAIQAELERQRDENLRIRAELDELRADSEEAWLTERRADEIRSIVLDTLADADTQSSLLQNGMTAGWDEHFFLASPDGRFKLQLDGQLQFRWMYNHRREARDRNRAGFEITRAKLTFSGHVFNPDVTYLVRMDPTRNEPGLVTGLHFLQDAWARIRLNDRWSVRVGQFKLPFNREELVASSRQLAVERSLVNEAMNIGRTQGVELAFAGRTSRVAFAFSDGGSDSLLPGSNNPVASLLRTAINTNALLEDTEWAFTARYEELIAGTWNQFADFTSPGGEEFGMLLGVAGHAQKTESGSFQDEIQWYGVTADLSIEWGGMNLFASVTHHYIDSIFGGRDGAGQINTTGIVVQGGVYLFPKLEVFGRFEYGIWDWEFLDLSDLTVGTVGFNYYLDGHDLKWTTDVGYGFSQVEASWTVEAERTLTGWRIDSPAPDGQLLVRTQLQLLF